MLGLLPTPQAPAPSPALPHVHSLPADPELLSKALQGRLALKPQLSDAALQLTATQHSGPGSPEAAVVPPRRGSSESGCAAVAARLDKDALLAPVAAAQQQQQDMQQQQQSQPSEQHQQQGDSPVSSSSADQPSSEQYAAHPGAHQTSPLSPATPVTPAFTLPQQSPAAAAAGASPDQVALLQAQLCAVNERAATLEFHLRAKSGEVAQLEGFRRRAQELEALYALSASELARTQEQHVAAQQAALSQLKSQQLRIMMLEEQIRMNMAAAQAGCPTDDLHTAILQQQLAAAHAQAAHSLSRAHSAAAGLAQVSSAFEAVSSMGMPAPTAVGMQSVQLSLGGHHMGMMERQASLPNPATGATMSDFARDSEIWSLRHHAASAATRGGPVRAQSLVLPPTGGADGGTWGMASAASVGFAAAASAAPLSLPPLPSASSASAWEAGALLMASRQPSLLDGSSHHHHHQPRESGDLISDRADAARLAGLLPFDLDTLGSERSEPGLPALSTHSLPPTTSLPPMSRLASMGSGGGARSAALKAAAAQKQAAAAAAQHLQLLAEKAADPRLARRCVLVFGWALVCLWVYASVLETKPAILAVQPPNPPSRPPTLSTLHNNKQVVRGLEPGGGHD